MIAKIIDELKNRIETLESGHYEQGESVTLVVNARKNAYESILAWIEDDKQRVGDYSKRKVQDILDCPSLYQQGTLFHVKYKAEGKLGTSYHIANTGLLGQVMVYEKDTTKGVLMFHTGQTIFQVSAEDIIEISVMANAVYAVKAFEDKIESLEKWAESLGKKRGK